MNQAVSPTPPVDIERIARACHEINRAYCLALGDDSQPAWTQAPEWQRTSAINGVKAHLANPDLTPKESHEAWLKEKLEQGWQWGPSKDEKRKLHPCVMQFVDLPVAQRAKDYIFKAVVEQFRGSDVQR